MSEEQNPKVFVSYTHETVEHKTWVRKLAEQLREEGIEVVLDQWDLRKGADLTHFMETNVREADRVLVIMTPTYRERANDRVGGVGYESLVLTGELASKQLTEKFIGILRSGDWDTSVPSFLRSRNHVDMRDDDAFQEKIQELAHDIHGVPLYSKPPLGTRGRRPESSSKRPSSNLTRVSTYPAEAIRKPQELEHPYYHWDVMVRQVDTTSRYGWSRAFRHCTVRILSEGLLKSAFLPEDRRTFQEAVAKHFPQDRATLEDPNSQGVRLRYSDPELRFDRTWTWGRASPYGLMGMAVTLPIVDQPTVYSVSDIANDVCRFLRVAAPRLGNEPAFIWLELHAIDLPFIWHSAEAAHKGRLLDFSPNSPPGRNSEALVQKRLLPGALLRQSVKSVAVELLQIALTDVHGVDVERAQLAKLLVDQGD